MITAHKRHVGPVEVEESELDAAVTRVLDMPTGLLQITYGRGVDNVQALLWTSTDLMYEIRDIRMALARTLAVTEEKGTNGNWLWITRDRAKKNQIGGTPAEVVSVSAISASDAGLFTIEGEA